MASMWRRAMLYLGLGPDEEYDDFDVTSEHQRAAAPRPPDLATFADEHLAAYGDALAERRAKPAPAQPGPAKRKLVQA